MGRKEGKTYETLDLKIPTFFRCPISLDVMRSPVSLCTGVTYDRSSIKSWLDSGHNTCPATMQPLSSTDLVPNLTLQRLIRHWSSTPSQSPTRRRRAPDLLNDLRDSPNPLGTLIELIEFLASDDVEDFEKRTIVGASGALRVHIGNKSDLEVIKASVRVFALILEAEFVDESGKRAVVGDLLSDLNGIVEALMRVIASSAEAIFVLDSVITAAKPEERIPIADKDGLIEELVRVLSTTKSATESGLNCLINLSVAAKRVRPRMVTAGVVPELSRILELGAQSAAEKALKVMGGVAGCAEGRAEMCKGEATAVAAVVRRMMKVGKEGNEAAVSTLWSVCRKFPDRRAVEAVAAAEGGATKLLLLMQSGCSPAARQMAAELLKVFRVNAKNCLPKYDTNTAHIMPF